MNTFREIATEIADLQERKNNDYGGAFSQSFVEFGIVSPIIRLSDKLGRLKSLTRGGIQQVKDESIEDTLKDLAAYSIMTIQELRRCKEK